MQKRRNNSTARWIGTSILILFLAGCAAPNKRTASSSPSQVSNQAVSDQAIAEKQIAVEQPKTSVPQLVVFTSMPREQGEKEAPPASQDFYVQDPADPFQGQAVLDFEQLKREVQTRNPTLQTMIFAWQAAAQRYPQEISLEDPMFGYMIGPAGVGPEGGYMVEASQKIPWFGKRQLRGEKADYEARAASSDVQDTRLMLAEAAANAYLDYYLARRQIDLNAANLELLREFRQVARARYEASQATQQDVLQTNIELAETEGRQIELTRQERVAVARINTLLHRAADFRLPPPVEKLAPPETLPPVEVFREAALSHRPDLSAEAARIKIEETNLALAHKDYYPDFEFVAKYDAFMEPDDMRPQVGMNVSVPLWKEKRRAALCEATAKLQQHRAAYAEKADKARFEVQSAYAMLLENQQMLRLYVEKILPSAEENVESARANYTAGKGDFLRLIEAQRQSYREQDKYYQAISDYHRRLAEMNRVTGGFAGRSAVPAFSN